MSNMLVEFGAEPGTVLCFQDGRRVRMVGKCKDTGDIVLDWISESGRRIERDILPSATLAAMHPYRDEPASKAK